MATIIKESISDLTELQGILWAHSNAFGLTLQVMAQVQDLIRSNLWKSLGEIIQAINAKLFTKNNHLKTLWKFHFSQKTGNYLVMSNDAEVRVALAIFTTNSRAEIALYDRSRWEKSHDNSWNTDPRLDLVIASKEFISLQSIDHKAWESFGMQTVCDSKLTFSFATQTTNWDNDTAMVVMPMIRLTFDADTPSEGAPFGDNIVIVSENDFRQMDPTNLTIKAQAAQTYLRRE